MPKTRFRYVAPSHLLLVGSAVLAGIAHAGDAQVPTVPTSAGASLGQGAFTETQVTNGKALYTANCAGCHGSGMRGSPGAPSILGLHFRQHWQGVPLGALFEFVRSAMPPGKAGSLPDADYLGIIIYILSRNGYPSGPQPLPSDSTALNNLIIEPLPPADSTAAP